MSTQPEILTRREASSLVITLNRPGRRNAIDIAMREQLRDALGAAQHDSDVAAVILTGAEGNFSAGGDISSMPRADDEPAKRRMRLMGEVVELMVTGTKPVIAAVEGFAFGAGMGLAAACDHVIASNRASLRASFAAIGLAMDTGLLWTLPRRVGYGPARELLLFATRIDAPRARQLGLVDALCEPGQALSEALARAGELASLSAASVRTMKQTLAAAPVELSPALAVEAGLQRELFASPEFAEGAAAFAEKRPPDFAAARRAAGTVTPGATAGPEGAQ